MKFHLNSFNSCQLKGQTLNIIANDQREITPKISKAELWFLCTTHRLIELYNCIMVVNLQSGHEIALQMIKGKK